MTDAISVRDPARPFSSLCLTVPRGSVDDPDDKPGVAWLTAQMMLRGAGELSRQALADRLEGLGSIVDLSVGRDHTTLWADALTRKRPELLDHLDAILGRPTFPAGELEKLKRETVAELQAVRDDDASLGLRFFVRLLYGQHLYGRPMKGSESSLATITRDDLVDSYRRWPREGSLLGVAGDIDPGLSLALAERLGQALASETAPRRVVPDFAPATGTGGWRAVIIDKPERSQTQVFVGHLLLADGLAARRGVHHPSWTALNVGQTPFGGTFTSRFSHEIREKRGWSYGAWGQLSGDHRLGSFMLRYAPSQKDLLPSLQLTDELLSTFVADGPTDAELDAAQSYLQNGFVFAVDTAQRRLSELLSARLLGHPDGWVDDTVERLRRVSHADAIAAVRTHLRADDLCLAVVGTASAIEPELAAWPRIRSIEVVDWKTPL